MAAIDYVLYGAILLGPWLNGAAQPIWPVYWQWCIEQQQEREAVAALSKCDPDMYAHWGLHPLLNSLAWWSTQVLEPIGMEYPCVFWVDSSLWSLVEHVPGTTHVYSIDFRAPQDAVRVDLRILKRFRYLKTLSFDGWALNKSDLKIICENSQLVSLHFWDCWLPEDPLKWLQQLRGLSDLLFAGTNITSYDLRRLPRFPQLEELYLFGDQSVDDCVIRYIAQLKQLRHLIVERPVSERGVERLRKKLPNAFIEY